MQPMIVTHLLLYMQMQLKGASDSIFISVLVSQQDLLLERMCLAVCLRLPLQS